MNYLSRNDVKKIAARATKLLDELGDELGLVVTYGGSRFNPKNAKIAFNFSTINSDGDAETPEVVAFKDYAFKFGLSKNDLGKTFYSKGYNWKITGLSPRARRYPVIAETSSGKRLRFGAKFVKNMLPKEDAA